MDSLNGMDDYVQGTRFELCHNSSTPNTYCEGMTAPVANGQAYCSVIVYSRVNLSYQREIESYSHAIEF
jgi:hypothetical protein